MVENLYVLVEQITIILCLFALYDRKFKIDILTMGVLVVNMILFCIKQNGYLNGIYMLLIAVSIFIYSLYEFDKGIKVAVTNNSLYIIIISLLQLMFGFPMIGMNVIIDNDDVMLLIVNILILTVILLFGKGLIIYQDIF